MFQVDLVLCVVIQLNLSPDCMLGMVVARVDQSVVHVEYKHSLVAKEITLVAIPLTKTKIGILYLTSTIMTL